MKMDLNNDKKLTWWPINFISNLRFSTLIRICSSEPLQSFTNSCIFTNKGLNIGLFKNWFVVIDVSEFDSYPRLCHMVLIIVIVFTLKEYKIWVKLFHNVELFIWFKNRKLVIYCRTLLWFVIKIQQGCKQPLHHHHRAFARWGLPNIWQIS